MAGPKYLFFYYIFSDRISHFYSFDVNQSAVPVTPVLLTPLFPSPRFVHNLFHPFSDLCLLRVCVVMNFKCIPMNKNRSVACTDLEEKTPLMSF